jgi:hypothetical protein
MSNPPPPADPKDGQGPGAGTDQRLAAVEAEQKRQGGVLDQILGRLPGAPAGPGGPTPPAAPAGPAGGPGGVDIASIQQQVRDEIAAADQRRQAEQKETKWRDDVTKTLERLHRERQPREPETGVRAMVQRMLIGRPQ